MTVTHLWLHRAKPVASHMDRNDQAVAIRHTTHHGKAALVHLTAGKMLVGLSHGAPAQQGLEKDR